MSGDFPASLPGPAPGPGAGSYPLLLPAARSSDRELDSLTEEVKRAIARRKLPPVRTPIDAIRLRVFLWRFLYSPEWPTVDSVWPHE